MCGLFGVVQKSKFNGEQLQRAHMARDMLIHRGPDQAGEWVKNSIYIGHRRLSILDTSEDGRQPMIDDQVVITVNGEIYNFQALRTELEAVGCKFSSSSDSEVLLHGYHQWGIDGLVDKIDGMYAAVIYDQAKEELFAIRDRVGIKPFYYFFDGSTFVWASELKAIVSYLGKDNLEIDNTAIIDFLTYRYIPAPKSLYKNIFKLPAASILKLELKSKVLSLKKYWQLPVIERDYSESEFSEELIHLLARSTKEQLVSDVALGSLLSGGIDSSAITAAAAKHNDKLHSFSIGFRDSEKDETYYAQLAAAHIGTNHQVSMLDPNEMTDLFERMQSWFDEPFGDTSAVPTYRVCDFAKKSVSVALSGDGGDELFGGYKWYQRFNKIRTWQKKIPYLPKYGFSFPRFIPKSSQLELLSIGDPVWLYARLRGSANRKSLNFWKKKLGVESNYDPLWAYRENYHDHLSPRKAAQIMDFHTYLPDDILTKVDRVSMAVSLECRPPFLSKELVEYAFSLPDEFIYKGGQLKGGLKFAVKALLPSNIINRAKQGFSVPGHGWKRDIIRQHSSLQEGIIEHFLKT